MMCLPIYPDGSDGQESACGAGDLGLIPGSGRSLGEGNGYFIDRGSWQAIVQGVTKNQTQLSD